MYLKLSDMEADLADGRKKFGAHSVSFRPDDVPIKHNTNIVVSFGHGEEVQTCLTQNPIPDMID
jgi:hypothetical protein